MSLSVVVQVCDRNFMLEQTIPTWLQYDCDEIVIFDQPQKEHAYDIVSRYLFDSRVKFIESLECQPYSLTKGRNVAIRNSTQANVLSLDADAKILSGMPKLLVEDNSYYHSVPGNTGTFLQGCVAFKRSDFDKINGYNERLIGWGYDDDDFRIRLEKLGLKYKSFPPYLFHINHDDNLRTKSYIEKCTSASWNNNHKSANVCPWTQKDEQRLFKVNVYTGSTKLETIV